MLPFDCAIEHERTGGVTKLLQPLGQPLWHLFA